MAPRSQRRRDFREVARLGELLEAQRLGCELAGSPLYATVLGAVGADLAKGGPCCRLLLPYAGSSFGDAVVLRFLAGVHALVLTGRAPRLALHYPSAGGSPGPSLESDFRAVVESHEAELAESLLRPVQTNEVGRCVPLLCGYLVLGESGMPLRVLEVGASAGLNLWFDHYRYEAAGLSVGPASSPLRFEEPFTGSPPAMDVMPTVAVRRGCDLDPIDPGTEAGVTRLRSLVWPDQTDRRLRLDAAIDCIRGEPPVVDAADALEWTGRHLAEAAEGLRTVVVHSIVLQYMPLDVRRRFVETVEDAGARATDDAPLAWLRMEPAGDVAETRMTTWPGGTNRVVATSGYHGPPVRVNATD
ncbi:MAG: DUF2332 domain-containing protein [Acidimicrobiales bacterium]|nr:DUF2332 domain-containing protein [Acidimicrobiales bacterium]